MDKPHDISELVLLWEEARQRGETVSPEELCSDCPELLTPLRDRVGMLDAMYRMLQLPPLAPTTLPHPDSEQLPVLLPEFPGYEVLEELGRGGMGVVYKARQLSLNRLVALKMIQVPALSSSRERGRLLYEAETIARLQHPTIVQVYDVGQQHGQPYFAMELMEKVSLRGRLTGAPMPAREAAALVETLARAMHAVHEQGVIHRDLKPSNILFTADGRPKISDFGLAKQILGEDSSLNTPTGNIVGTPAYMAPEQAAGKRSELGPAADIYALGVLLYELLTGRLPFQGETTLETLQKVVDTEPTPPSRLHPRLPRDIETICLKCLEKDRWKRYGTALDLADELRRFQDGKPILARPVRAAERLLKWVRRKPTLAALAATILMALLTVSVGSTWFSVQLQGERDGLRQALLFAETSRYAMQIDGAQRELLAGNFSRVESLLHATHSDLRHWEHRLLESAHRRSQHVFHGHSGPLTCVAVSPDGRWLASGSRNPASGGELLVWDLQLRRVAKEFSAPVGAVHAVTFHPKGKLLAAAGAAGLSLIEVDTWKPLPRPVLLDQPASSVAFHPLVPQLAVATQDGCLHFLDWQTGKAGPPLHSPDGPVVEMAFTPDGNRLATLSGAGKVYVWNLSSGQSHPLFLGATSPLRGLRLSPDGTLLAAGVARSEQGEPSRVQVWHLETGKVVRELPAHGGTVHGVFFSSDGSLLGSAGESMQDVDREGEIKVWRTSNWTVAASLRGPAQGTAAGCFSPDQKQIFAANLDATVHQLTWNPTLESQLLAADNLEVRSVAFRPGDRYLACTGTEAGQVDLPAAVLVWDIQKQTLIQRLSGQKGMGLGVAFSPEDRYLASACGDGIIRVWNTHDWQIVREFTLPNMAAAVAFSPDGKRLAGCSRNWKDESDPTPSTLKVWDLSSGTELLNLQGHTHSLLCLAFSPDGHRVTAGGIDTKIWVWNAATGAIERGISGPLLGVQKLAFLQDSTRLISAAGRRASLSKPGFVTLWNAAAGKELQQLTGHQGYVFDLCCSIDDKRVATASADLTVKLWDLQTGVSVLSLPGHTRAVTCVAFSTDGRRLVSGSRDHTVRIWDAGARGQ